MRIRTARELGAVLRGQRRRLALSQNEVSRKAGVSRKWVVEMERGKAPAELTLVLRVLEAVELVLNVERGIPPGQKHRGANVDINAIVGGSEAQDMTNELLVIANGHENLSQLLARF